MFRSIEEYHKVRAEAALEVGVTLYRKYGEEEAAHIIGVDLSTLKRWRRAGKIPFVNLGERSIRYWGFMILDIMLLGADKCLSTPSVSSNAESTGFPKTESPQPIAAHGMTKSLDKRAVQALAQTTFKKPKSG